MKNGDYLYLRFKNNKQITRFYHAFTDIFEIELPYYSGGVVRVIDSECISNFLLECSDMLETMVLLKKRVKFKRNCIYHFFSDENVRDEFSDSIRSHLENGVVIRTPNSNSSNHEFLVTNPTLATKKFRLLEKEYKIYGYLP